VRLSEKNRLDLLAGGCPLLLRLGDDKVKRVVYCSTKQAAQAVEQLAFDPRQD
jgi:hypothetical protein